MTTTIFVPYFLSYQNCAFSDHIPIFRSFNPPLWNIHSTMFFARGIFPKKTTIGRSKRCCAARRLWGLSGESTSGFTWETIQNPKSPFLWLGCQPSPSLVGHWHWVIPHYSSVLELTSDSSSPVTRWKCLKRRFMWYKPNDKTYPYVALPLMDMN